MIYPLLCLKYYFKHSFLLVYCLKYWEILTDVFKIILYLDYIIIVYEKNIGINCFIGGRSILRRRLQSFSARGKTVGDGTYECPCRRCECDILQPGGYVIYPL